jgi:uncharacterized protein
MNIQRIYNLNEFLNKKRVLIIYGPRRVGKTTLLKNFLTKTKLKFRLDSGDNIKTQEILSSQNFTKILNYTENYDLLVIDEAQQIPNIGMGLKILVDQVGIPIIVTGSSSFDLANQTGEPLTGRKNTLTLYPFSQKELLKIYNKHELKEKLEDFLIFGTYPEIITTQLRQQKISILEELVNSYLFKDVFNLDKIKKSQVIVNLVKLLAFQIGSEVSLNELATQLSIDVKTVAKYLDLLEKSFVIFKLNGFSRNLRKELTSKSKYYFWDNGIRNAVIYQFNAFDQRNDFGQLWENFIFIERLKKRTYENIYGQAYFWRTYNQQEIDLIEERDGKLFAFEFKFSAKKQVKIPADWKKNYSNSEFQVINQENYLEFV